MIDHWKLTEELKGLNYQGFIINNSSDMGSLYNYVKNKFANNRKIEIVRDYSANAAGRYTDDFFDWLYIDGSHLYHEIVKDLNIWFPKVKQGGYILGDDYYNPRYEGNPVSRAVNEFISKHNLKLKVYGSQYIIYK